MSRIRSQMVLMALAFAIVVVGSLAAQAPAWAQGSDEWSFIVTPQIWATHIAKNGFATPGGLGSFYLVDPAGHILQNTFPGENSSPVDSVDPQWGIQLAAQKGRWTLAGSFQYVSFETRSDIIYRPPNGLPAVIGAPPIATIAPNDRAAQEFVDTTRVDIDLAASYLFPDVMKDRLDLSLGGGVKVIYAQATRQFANLSPFAAVANVLLSGPNPGLYSICKQDNCSDFHTADRVKTKDVIYGATIPMSATVHLTNDAKWLLPFSVTPLIGAETRDDRDVVYRFRDGVVGIPVRLDGTTFAYGVTTDMTVRYLLNDTVSVYGGMRAQYIHGHEEYLAYGPLIGMSVRFGGK